MLLAEPCQGWPRTTTPVVTGLRSLRILCPRWATHPETKTWPTTQMSVKITQPTGIQSSSGGDAGPQGGGNTPLRTRRILNKRLDAQNPRETYPRTVIAFTGPASPEPPQQVQMCRLEPTIPSTPATKVRRLGETRDRSTTTTDMLIQKTIRGFCLLHQSEASGKSGMFIIPCGAGYGGWMRPGWDSGIAGMARGGAARSPARAPVHIASICLSTAGASAFSTRGRPSSIPASLRSG
mmetsp:Transcript_29568/g.83392  ORF Transcript_29568/g.83392 Transcript_29568/m.83392 type:complete len:237 (+) Transcript_29568:258-968(+)